MNKRNLLLVLVALFSVTTLPGCKAVGGVSNGLPLGNAYASPIQVAEGSSLRGPVTASVPGVPNTPTLVPLPTGFTRDTALVPYGSSTFGGPR